jgi:hypothetical protein
MNDSIVQNGGESDGPATQKVTRLLQWTHESDCYLEIDDDRSDEEIIKAFVAGEFDYMKPVVIANRLSYLYGINIAKVETWGGDNG